MKIRGLMVAAAVFFILAGILYWSERHKPAEDAANAAGDSPPAILKLDEATITRLELDKKDAPPVVLAKGDSGKWQITAPGAFRADPGVVSGVLSALSSLNSERLVEDKAADLKPYGLDHPALQVVIGEKNNKTQKLLIGDNTPTGTVYATLAGDPRIYTVATYAKTSVEKGLDDLRDKKLFDFGFAEPTKVELHIGAKAYALTRSGEEWQQEGQKLDGGSVQALIGKLRDLSAEKFLDSGFTRATIEVSVASDEGKRVEKVSMAKSSVGYVAKREDDPVLYLLNTSSVDELQKAAEAIKPTASSGR